MRLSCVHGGLGGQPPWGDLWPRRLLGQPRSRLLLTLKVDSSCPLTRKEIHISDGVLEFWTVMVGVVEKGKIPLLIHTD